MIKTLFLVIEHKIEDIFFFEKIGDHRRLHGLVYDSPYWGNSDDYENNLERIEYFNDILKDAEKLKKPSKDYTYFCVVSSVLSNIY